MPESEENFARQVEVDKREQSESEPSWSSVDEEETIRFFDNEKFLLGQENAVVKEITETPVVKKCRRKRNEKGRPGNRRSQVVVGDQEGALQLRPLLSPS